MVRMSLDMSFTRTTLSDTVLADFASRSISVPRLDRFRVQRYTDYDELPAGGKTGQQWPHSFGGRSIYGSLAGTAIDTEDALAFSVLENIRPMIETLPLEQAAEAYARMMQGKARFRMVLVTNDRIV
jgi:hypothetical protein